ncbi:MAG: M23 family metallopeptidase [Candidatus Cloacimonadota bacterium]|nr:M23 family metallopeptidase [Candidatus Cloacimonadota bacterium]
MKFNIIKALFLILFIIISIQLTAAELITLRGNPTQGGILICETDTTIEKIFLDHKEIPISENRAIIGFDRDEKLKHKITIVLENGEMYTSLFYIAKRNYEIQKIDRIEKKYIEEPRDSVLIQRISDESNILKSRREKINKNKNIYFDEFCMPINDGRISGVFGSQRILNGIPKRPHNGFDIAAPKGTDIFAMTTGIVALTGDYYYNGKFVLLDHGSGFSSIYIHMSKLSVKRGDYILTGEKIGEVGSTGRSTGNHLHWGVGWKDKRIDPELLQNMDDVFLKFSVR